MVVTTFVLFQINLTKETRAERSVAQTKRFLKAVRLVYGDEPFVFAQDEASPPLDAMQLVHNRNSLAL